MATVKLPLNISKVVLDTYDAYINTQQTIIKFHMHNIKSAYLDIEIQNNGAILDITDCIVRISFEKADRKKVILSTADENPAITVTNATLGQVQVVLPPEVLAAAGTVVSEVELESEGVILPTQSFTFTVQKAIITDEAIESTDYFPSLYKAIQFGDKLGSHTVDDVVIIVGNSIDGGTFDDDDTESIVADGGVW